MSNLSHINVNGYLVTDRQSTVITPRAHAHRALIKFSARYRSWGNCIRRPNGQWPMALWLYGLWPCGFMALWPYEHACAENQPALLAAKSVHVSRSAESLKE